jgi:hypothetical protein
MNEEFSDLRIHDPKIVPPPDECVLVEFELSRKERQCLEQAAEETGCWSLEEFIRSVTAESVVTCKNENQR